MPTGLQKLVIEAPFKGGMTEKIHKDMAEPEGVYVLENVELDKVGALRRRRGFEVMSDAIVGSVLTSGSPLKLGPRDDEIFKITEELASMGSGGGGGSAGAMIYSYSPEADAWRENGKVPSVTLERFAGLANGQVNPESVDVGYALHEGKDFVVMVFTNGDFNGFNIGMYVLAYDTTSRSMVLEPTLVTEAFGGKMQVVSIGQYAVILYRPFGDDDFCARVYDASNNLLSDEIVLFTGDEGKANKWCGTTDGISLFIAYSIDGVDVFVRKYTVTGTSIVSDGVATETASVQGGLWASLAGGVVHVSWHDLVEGLMYWSVGASTPSSLVTPVVISTEIDDSASRTYIAGLNSTESVIFWDRAGDDTVDFSVNWRWVKDGITAPAGRANEHRSPGVQVAGGPFIYNGRAFVPLIGASYKSPTWELPYQTATSLGQGLTDFGFCVAEVNSVTAAEDFTDQGNAYATFFPVAVWARDVSRYALPGLGAFGGGSDRYIATVRQARQSDAFFTEKRSQLTPISHNVAIWSFDIIKLNFNDVRRWQHAEGNQATVLAGAVPYCYDGMNAHECGFIFRPSILSVEEVASGSFGTGQTVNFKIIYEWEDVRGGRWFSDTSRAVSYTVTADDKALKIKVRLPAMTAKPAGGSQFGGRVRVNAYRATEEAPDDYKIFNSSPFMIFDISGNEIVTYMEFTDDGNNSLESNERLYLFGGELDNSLAPPCRSIVQHRNRLFCIDTENNKLWYTKPFNRDRGFEWSAFQTKALPSRGMSLESVEGSLIVYCERQILVLEGSGPSSTGQPADAYSQFMVLTQDTGCSEVNASWRIPGGAIFKNSQGLWSIGGALGVSYIGQAVEEFVSTVVRFIDGTLDESQACLRLLVERVSEEPVPGVPGATQAVAGYWQMNYWFDTQRWSVDKHNISAGTMFSNLFHRGDFYLATSEGVLRRSETRFHDGPDADVTDSSDVYLMKVQTGRMRIDSLASFKRLWRMLLMLRHDSDDGPGLDVRLTAEVVGAPGGTTTRVFSGHDLTQGVPATLRMHLAKQKGQTYRFTAEEVATLDTKLAAEGPPGYTFLGLGLELGLRRVAAKQSVGRSL